jgi:hypothetical protein
MAYSGGHGVFSRSGNQVCMCNRGRGCDVTLKRGGIAASPIASPFAEHPGNAKRIFHPFFAPFP